MQNRVKIESVTELVLPNRVLYFKHADEAGFYAEALQLKSKAKISFVSAVVINDEYHVLKYFKHEINYYIKTLERNAIHPYFMHSYSYSMCSAQGNDGVDVEVSEVRVGNEQSPYKMYIDENGKYFEVEQAACQFAKLSELVPEYSAIEKTVNDARLNLIMKNTEAKNSKLRLLEQLRSQISELEKEESIVTAQLNK